MDAIPLDSPTSPSEIRYATFTRRARALVVDSAVVSAVAVAAVLVADAANGIPGTGRIAWLVMFAAIFLYEPLLVGRRGATIGHAANHLTVVDARTGRPPGFARAALRYLIKLVLGVPSFVTMALTRRHQAVHDALTGTTVQVAPDYQAAPDEYHLERVADGASLPSRTRRVLIILLYEIVLLMASGLLVAAIVPSDCLDHQACTADQRATAQVLSVLWLVGAAAILVAGWRGALFGARRRTN
jgi:uncharacterized RDD family membrane protein YckC